jgi:hypothetical protein
LLRALIWFANCSRCTLVILCAPIARPPFTRSGWTFGTYMRSSTWFIIPAVGLRFTFQISSPRAGILHPSGKV